MDLIRNNFLLKIFSLALAVLIYAAVKSHLRPDSGISLNLLKPIERRTFTPPVRLLISPGPAQGYKVTPETVTLTLSGQLEDLQDVSPSQIQVYVRLDEARGPMMSEFQLEVNVPRDVTVESLFPERVSVETVSGNFMVFPFTPMK